MIDADIHISPGVIKIVPRIEASSRLGKRKAEQGDDGVRDK